MSVSDLRSVLRKQVTDEELLQCNAFLPVLHNNVYLGLQKEYPQKRELLLEWPGASTLRCKVKGKCVVCGRQRLLSMDLHGVGRVGFDCFSRLNTARIAFATLRHWNTLVGGMSLKSESVVQVAMQNMECLLQLCHDASEYTRDKYARQSDEEEHGEEEEQTDGCSADATTSSADDETTSSADDETEDEEQSDHSSADATSSADETEEDEEQSDHSSADDETEEDEEQSDHRYSEDSSESDENEWDEAEEDQAYDQRTSRRRKQGLGYVAAQKRQRTG